MTINQMICFDEVSKTKSIPKVARMMNITPNGLRLSLHRMEEELGVNLIVWGSSKGFTLTEDGEVFLAGVREIRRIYEQCINDLTTEKESKPLRVASGLNFPSAPLGELLRKYTTVNPDFRFTVTDYTSEQCDEAVLNDEAEIGINTGPFDPRVFSCWPCFRYSLYMVVNRDNPLSEGKFFPVEALGEHTLCVARLKPGDTSFSDMCAA